VVRSTEVKKHLYWIGYGLACALLIGAIGLMQLIAQSPMEFDAAEKEETAR
jgi:hypothetical protein